MSFDPSQDKWSGNAVPPATCATEDSKNVKLEFAVKAIELSKFLDNVGFVYNDPIIDGLESLLRFAMRDPDDFRFNITSPVATTVDGVGIVACLAKCHSGCFSTVKQFKLDGVAGISSVDAATMVESKAWCIAKHIESEIDALRTLFDK